MVELARRRVVSLRLGHVAQVVQECGDEFAVAEVLGQAEGLLVVFARLCVVSLEMGHVTQIALDGGDTFAVVEVVD